MTDVTARPRPCFTTIRAMYEELTDAERRVADYILSEPGYVAVSSIQEVARASGTGPATVGRLCTKLGYAGFPKLKVALAVEVYNTPDRDGVNVADNDEDSAVIRQVFSVAEQSLRDTSTWTAVTDVVRCAELLLAARRTEIYAVGGLSIAMAYVFQHRLLVAGVPCAVIAGGQQQESMAAGLLGTDDVAIGISKSGVTPRVLEALQTASGAGAHTIGLSSSPGSQLAELTDLTLVASGAGDPGWSHPPASHVSMHALIDAVYVIMLRRRYLEK
ncbi:MurR/RpiR family transcriptional regulator [Streptomyces sp. NPDC001508]|uniref:MurR/RpiR family transcriptional regulator n=1 Tax=Streptomyces sp. NPDC001508 TaxID=3154656 RepID=UPI003328B018